MAQVDNRPMKTTDSDQPPMPLDNDPSTPDSFGRTDDQPLPLDPEQIESEDEVDEASDESFPASDPPSYSRSSTTKD
jgi:hypothetical protein